MPWSTSQTHFGFTSGRPWLPIPADWRDKTVEAQKSFTEESNLSFLQLYQKSLRLRKLFASLDFNWLTRTNDVIGFTRGSEYAIYSNTSGQELQVTLPEYFAAFEIMLCSAPRQQPRGLQEASLLLPPHSTTWVKRLK